MAQSFCQRVRRLSTGQWSHVLKKPLKGCMTSINETYLYHTQLCAYCGRKCKRMTKVALLHSKIRENSTFTALLHSKILLWFVSPHKKVGSLLRDKELLLVGGVCVCARVGVRSSRQKNKNKFLKSECGNDNKQ
jgi:hypothetical protein